MSTTFSSNKQSKQLFPDKAKVHIDAGALLIDVREPEEHAQARIRGSVLIPMSELRQRLREIPRDREVIFYCRSGNRSGQVVEYLSDQLGYENVINLAGGIIAWYRRDLPVDTSPAQATYQTTRYEAIDVLEAKRRLHKNGIKLVDVREAVEFRGGHLPGAINIPLNTIPAHLEDLRGTQPLLLVCQTGNRSAIAADWLIQQGLEGVSNIEGGTTSWIRHGLAVEP
ncbi:MAG: rhodanese-like domain-containing protein [Chloroflexi bacterium]|nr:rhodanese-like domain-containing protein [Chloroflexota bacterium]